MQDNTVTKAELEAFRVRLLAEIRHELAGAVVPKTERWLKSAEVRKLLRISPGTLQTLRNNGTLKYSLVGGIYYYAASHIEALMPRGNANVTSDA